MANAEPVNAEPVHNYWYAQAMAQTRHDRLNPPGQMRLLPYAEWLERVKKVNSVLVEVRVNWKTTSTEYSDQQYWKTYKTEINVKCLNRPELLLSPTGGIDALWKVLTGCLLFKQWRQCDFTTLDYEAYGALDPHVSSYRVSSYNLDVLGNNYHRISEHDMKVSCWEEQSRFMKEPLFRYNGMPKTLLVVLYYNPVEDDPNS